MRSRRTWRRGAAVIIGVSVLGITGLAGATVAPAQAAYVDGLGYDPIAAKGSLWHIAEAIGAHEAYEAGYTGEGVGIALVDTGVTEVRGLDTGNVVHGPDLSFDSQDPELAHKDAYGHGTHLASIIAGRDAAGSPASYTDESAFNGIAPDADLISVKVGAHDGAVDVTQVIAAIDWVVEHRTELNIRVLNLSYGTDSVQDPMIDPLTFAVERAWEAGIVVVVAGGNDGSGTTVLANPARSPYVIAVGASDTQGTVDPADDTVPGWATRGTNSRHVDLVAPGVSVLGARVPNGYADERNPQARTGTRFARASGTSQAAAVVSGAAALLLEASPDSTPDQVKLQLQSTARPFRSTDVKYRGNGLVDVRAAQLRRVGNAAQPPAWLSTGLGSVEAARGSSHVHDGSSELRGEVDIFGNSWDAGSWAAMSAAGTAWDGGSWRGATWSGDGWDDDATWRDVEWASGTWSSKTWRTDDWSSKTWRDGAWSGDGWSSKTWRDESWSSKTWRHADLASVGWLMSTWG